MTTSTDLDQQYALYVQQQVLERLRTVNQWGAMFFFPVMFGIFYIFNPTMRDIIVVGFLLCELGPLTINLILLKMSWFPRHYEKFFFFTALILPLTSKFVIYSLGDSDDNTTMIVCSVFLVAVGLLYPVQNRACIIFCLIYLATYLLPWPRPEDFQWISHLSECAVIFLFSLIVVRGNLYLDELRQSEFAAQTELAAEKAKSDSLISNILPVTIAARLKESPRVADNIAETTVLFADLVGFTQLSSSMLPSRVVAIIDNIFTRFDAVMEKHSLEKIKTVGDAYMAVSGVPIASESHAIDAAYAALELRKELAQLNQEMDESLDIRIGLHSGPLVAGVIGTKKLSYDVWGDTVNVASRMESHSETGKIQISETTYHAIKSHFRIEPRGEIEVKGKGPMKTFFLVEEKT